MLFAKLRRYVRQHHIGLLALFVALGGSAYAAAKVNSKDVADNSLTGADVKGRTGKHFTQGSLTGADIRGSAASGKRKAVDGSVTGDDLKDDSVTGLDVLEASLGPVPQAAKAGDAETVGGLGPGAFASVVRTNVQATGVCATSTALLNECASVTINVPEGRTYRAAIWSSASFDSSTDTDVRLCAGVRNLSADGPKTCLSGGGYADELEATAFNPESAAASGDTRILGTDLGPGAWKFSTMIRPFSSLSVGQRLLAHTTVLVTDASAPGLPGVPDGTCCSTDGSSTASGAGSSGASSSGASSAGPESSGG